MLEEVVGIVKLLPQERVQWIVEHTADMPVSQLVQRTVRQVPVRQILEEAVEVMKLVPQERVQQRTPRAHYECASFSDVGKER